MELISDMQRLNRLVEYLERALDLAIILPLWLNYLGLRERMRVNLLN